MIVENVALREERKNMESKYRKAVVSTAQCKKDEASMRKVVAELCSEFLDMQLDPDAPVMENIQKVVVCTKAIALRMDIVKTEYKARIEELEK